MTDNNPTKILITGANGFIGRHLCLFLKDKKYVVKAAVRNTLKNIPMADEYIQVGDINESTDWQQALMGVDIVIHLAARVHVMKDKAVDADAFYKVNVHGTEHLARMAALAGVKRFIFISSVKVNGDGRDRPYTELDPSQPQDPYGRSKAEAEEALIAVAVQTGLKTVIVRLPLVYGPGVKANFKNLIKMVGAGLPIPFKGIRNQRSFIYIGNVIDAIALCITHPLALGETFLVSDGEDISTPDLIKMIAVAMNKKVILFSLNFVVLKGLATMLGHREAMEKLAGSLCVDSQKIRNRLGWKPPFTFGEGIAKTVKEYYVKTHI